MKNFYVIHSQCYSIIFPEKAFLFQFGQERSLMQEKKKPGFYLQQAENIL